MIGGATDTVLGAIACVAIYILGGAALVCGIHEDLIAWWKNRQRRR